MVLARRHRRGSKIRIEGTALLFTGLLFLIIPGAIYNNLVNSGLGVTSPTFDCSHATAAQPTCQLSAASGCALNANNCLPSAGAISFLNTNSPFTQLLQGNIFALFNNLNPLSSSGASQTSWSGTHGPFDITGNPNYYSADCQGNNATASLSQQKWSPFPKCTQTNTDNSNITKANVVTWNNWNNNWNTTLGMLFYQPGYGNATFHAGCSWIAQINYTLLANGPGYTYWGCSITNSGHGGGTSQYPGKPTDRTWSLLLAYPVSNGPMPACKTSLLCSGVHVHMFVQLTNWFTQVCVPNSNLGYYTSVQCGNFLKGFQGVAIPGTNITFVPNSAGAIVFGFLAGIILLIGGLGLQIGVGGGVSAGTNPQGTKLFQAMGMGLILWSFFSSEFSGWFSSGLFPWGLDGLTGFIGILIDFFIFVGMYLLTVQGNAATAE